MPGLPRTLDDDSASSDVSSFQSHKPIYIAGICVVGVIMLGLAIWMAFRFYRKRAQSKREKKQGAAFLSVRGLVRDDANEKDTWPQNSQALPGNVFSREHLTESIVLPDKVLAPPKTRQEIMDYHRQSGNFPHSFNAKPFTFAIEAAEPTKRDSTLSFNRNSFMSVASNISRYSVTSANSSIDSNPTSGVSRKVRQNYSPVLPDELLISLGERVTLVQSFDDGWCLVGKENTLGGVFTNPKSLFKSHSPSPSTSNDNVELGVVPAWCFLKPVKGLHAERPIRSTSLGITVQMEKPGFSSREEVVSWSNF